MYNPRMIVVKNLTKSYSDNQIFSNINLKIGNRVKIGLVGKNGCGKTTLFKILNGVEEPTAGNIELQNEVLAYIPQEFNFKEDLVGEFLENLLDDKSEFYKVDALVTKLNFQNFDIYQKIDTLSEGQKMKLKLIETMLKEPTTLFIDEPTNHLDIEGIMWFEDYIRKLNINVVIISHDRSFLNNTVDEIWEIDRSQIFKFTGNYDFYKEEKLKLINQWDKEYIEFIKRKQKLEKLLENVHKIKDGKKRGSAVSSVKKRIEREVTQNEKEKYTSKRISELDLKTGIPKGKLMIRFTDVYKSFGSNVVFSKLNFELRGKEKVWLCGPNGAGKSTIVKLIMGFEKADSGEIKIGENISVGYFSQIQTHLDSKNNLLDEFTEKTGCYFAKSFGYLSQFLFDKKAVQKKVGQLSPGERARFAFAIFAYKDYDMLILDEPDNHLDIETKEVLEKSLRNYKGTLLLISHDRYFVEEVGIDKIFNLSNGVLSVYAGE